MTTLERFLKNQPALNRAGPQEFTRAIWGGIAEEYDALQAEIDKITSLAVNVNNLYGDELDEVILRYVGIDRRQNESDALRLNLLHALYIRENIPSWATVHSIRKVFRAWFPDTQIYIKENQIEADDELITDGGFEGETVGVKTAPFGEWTPAGTEVAIEDTDTFEGSRVLHGNGTGTVSCTKAVTEGAYILSSAFMGYSQIQVQRDSDSYYWDFDVMAWTAEEAESVNQSIDAYSLLELPIFVDGSYNVTITFGLGYDDFVDGGDPSATGPDVLDGGDPTSTYTVFADGGAPYMENFWFDLISFGVKPGHPYVHVLVSTFSQGGSFLNNWPAGADPLGGSEDYANSTYLGLDFIGGEGTGTPTEYYATILSYIKPAGVKTAFSFVGRV